MQTLPTKAKPNVVSTRIHEEQGYLTEFISSVQFIVQIFFVPRSCCVDQLTFHISLQSLKFLNRFSFIMLIHIAYFVLSGIHLLQEPNQVRGTSSNLVEKFHLSRRFKNLPWRSSND